MRLKTLSPTSRLCTAAGSLASTAEWTIDFEMDDYMFRQYVDECRVVDEATSYVEIFNYSVRPRARPTQAQLTAL